MLTRADLEDLEDQIIKMHNKADDVDTVHVLHCMLAWLQQLMAMEKRWK